MVEIIPRDPWPKGFVWPLEELVWIINQYLWFDQCIFCDFEIKSSK